MTPIEPVRQGDQEEIRGARRTRGQDGTRADEDQRECPDELGNPLSPRGDRHLAPPPAA